MCSIALGSLRQHLRGKCLERGRRRTVPPLAETTTHFGMLRFMAVGYAVSLPGIKKREPKSVSLNLLCFGCGAASLQCHNVEFVGWQIRNEEVSVRDADICRALQFDSQIEYSHGMVFFGTQIDVSDFGFSFGIFPVAEV